MQLLNTSLIYKYVTDYKSFKNSTRAIRQYMNRTYKISIWIVIVWY